ncbi:MAG: DedA family protein [Candidatus Taylorbacteria bacterium]|nr:DedA family protein [Candidatus Taylorbacteria bacterium]
MMQKLVDWLEKWASHHHATKALSLVAFTESSFFPIPPFVLIVAMLIPEKRPSWLKLAVVGMLSSVAGGVFGYFIGKFFYGYIGAPLVSFYGLESEVGYLGNVFKDHVFMTIFLASLSPLPYKVFTISAGLFSVNIWSFIAASVIGRSIRFFVVSYLADKYGIRAKKFIIEQQKFATVTVFLAIVLGFLYFFLYPLVTSS